MQTELSYNSGSPLSLRAGFLGGRYLYHKRLYSKRKLSCRPGVLLYQNQYCTWLSLGTISVLPFSIHLIDFRTIRGLYYFASCLWEPPQRSTSSFRQTFAGKSYRRLSPQAHLGTFVIITSGEGGSHDKRSLRAKAKSAEKSLEWHEQCMLGNNKRPRRMHVTGITKADRDKTRVE